jgi:hypothetical protein
MLRVDPGQRHRHTETIDNLQQRIDEATECHWLGEVQGLKIGLDAATAKLTTLDRTAAATAPGPTLLGLPSYPQQLTS